MTASAEKTPQELINELYVLAQTSSSSAGAENESKRIKEIVDLLNAKCGAVVLSTHPSYESKDQEAAREVLKSIADKFKTMAFSKEMVQKIFKAVNNNNDNYFYDDITRKNSVCFFLHSHLPSSPSPISQPELDSDHLIGSNRTASQHLIQLIKKEIDWYDPHNRHSKIHRDPLDAALKCLEKIYSENQEELRDAYDNLVKAQKTYESATSLASSISPNSDVKKLCELAIMQAQPKYEALPPAPVRVHVSEAGFFAPSAEETKQPQAPTVVAFPGQDERPKKIEESFKKLANIYQDIVKKKTPYSKKEAPQYALIDAVFKLEEEGITQEKINNINKILLPAYNKESPPFSSTVRNAKKIVEYAEEVYSKALAQQAAPAAPARKLTG